MLFIIAFALLLMACSIYMIIFPKRWSAGIIRFSDKHYFHLFEVISRLIFGLIFLAYYEISLFPSLFKSIGYLLLLVSIGLLLVGSVKHRAFSVWSANAFQHTFKYAGIGSFIFSIFLLYAVI